MIETSCCNSYDKYEEYENKKIHIGALNILQNEDNCICLQSRCIDVKIKKDDNIRLDLTLGKTNISKLWGQIKDDNGMNICGAIVTLLKPRYIKGDIEYFPVSTTISDYMGFYQFNIERLEKGLTYKVLANKS